jgi:hypothetical protein
LKLLPIETINAVWRAALPNCIPSERQAKAVGEWLARTLERAERDAARVKKVSLTRKDVDRVESAYKRFQVTLLSLQDRDYPPPMISETSGATDWEHWIGSNNPDFKRGRDPEYDWVMIGALLQLYEAITGNDASGADVGGPTIKFLDDALEALSRLAAPESRHGFHSPSGDGVDRELTKLRPMWNGIRDPRLRRLRDL